MSRRNKEVNKEVPVMDAFSNPLFRLGFGSQAPLEATEYPLTRLTQNYALLNSMYRSGGILQSVVDIIPADMCREWFTLGGDIDPEDMDKLETATRRTKLRASIIDGLKWGRLYGGAIGLIMIRGQERMLDKPLKIESVLPDSFAGLYILDRWSGVNPQLSLVSDISDPDFGLPEYYDINSGEGSQIVARVHHSRVVRFTGRELPYLEKIAELYWGESEVEPIYDDIVLYDNIMHNMGNLTFRANIDTMEVQNLDQLFSVNSKEQQKRFWDVMQAQSVAQSNFGTRLVNKGDQVTNTQYTFTGWNYVTEAAQLNLCAKTHIPMTKLFGRAPAGLSATGEGDMKNYYDIVDGEREAKLRPALERVLPVLCMSAWGEVPEDLSITFPPLWTPNATEIAQIAKMKADTVIAAFQSGLLDVGGAQKELQGLAEETGMFDAISDEDIEANKGKTYQDVTAMADPMAGLFGNESGSSDEGEDRGPFETQDGGKGSGNFGHSGRPGMVGGSGAGGSNKVLTYAQARAKLKSPQGWHSVSDWSRQNLVGHFNGSGEEDDHKADYPGWSISDYQNWSKLLLSHEPDNETLFGVEVGEYRYRFCAFTGDFVKEHMGKGIVTMFRPKGGKGYYERQIG